MLSGSKPGKRTDGFKLGLAIEVYQTHISSSLGATVIIIEMVFPPLHAGLLCVYF